MLLQRGRITIDSIECLEQVPKYDDGTAKFIELDYMGKLEYEGNAIPISRMFIEYNKEDYLFYSTGVFNSNNEEMIIYINSSVIKDEDKIRKLIKYLVDRNYSIYEQIKYPNKALNNFWWDINGDYFIFFGEPKMELITYFIEKSFERDGGKLEIAKKLSLVGYNL